MAQTPLEIAQRLIRLGRAPIPIPFKEKGPKIPHWQHLRLTAEEAPKYFNGAPMNVGVLLGEPSQWLIDIDLDTDETIAAAPYLLPRTGTFGRKTTPESHWLYESEGAATKKWQWKGETLVELRSTGCQTVWPGSTHPSGEVVEYANKAVPVRIAPDDLARLVGRVAAAGLVGKFWVGSRHDLALALSGALLHANWSDIEVATFVSAVVAAGQDEEVLDRQRAVQDTISRFRAGEPTSGWPRLAELLEAEVVKKLRQWLAVNDLAGFGIGAGSAPPPADEWPEAEPLRRELPPAEPFPLDALGDVLQPMAQALVEIVQVPAALAGQSVLAAAALVVQAHADVEIDGRVFPVSDFFVTVAESGERKTATDREALAPVQKWQRDRMDGYRLAQAEHEVQRTAWDKARQAALNSKEGTIDQRARAALDCGPEPLPPLRPLMICQEPTAEGLVRALKDDAPTQGLFSDEGGRFLGGHAMSVENQLRTLTTLSCAWDGTPISRTRGGDGNVMLYGRRVSMHLMVQPLVADVLFGSELALSQGMLSRCLTVFPETTIGRRPYREAALSGTPAAARYFARLSELLERPWPLREGGEHELEPRRLLLRPDAKAQWILFHDHIEGLCAEGRELSSIRGLAAKAAEHCLRLAGTLATVGHAEQIQLQHVEAGILLVEHYLSEALRLFEVADQSPDLRLAEKLLRWLISRSSRFSRYFYPAPIYQHGPRPIRDKETANRILGVLYDHGWIRPVGAAIEIDGAMRRNAWELRP